MPSIALDRASAVPMHRQIYHQIAAAVRDGEIPAGVRLPSSRSMARLLGVSRNTVLTALGDLTAEGVLRGKPGAGMWVNGSRTPAVTLFGLRDVIRTSGYPARIVVLADVDGNPIYLRY